MTSDHPDHPGRSVPLYRSGRSGLHLPAGTTATGPYATAVEPERAGWRFAGLRVLDLPPGGSHGFDAGGSEWIVLPLSGGCTVEILTVTPDGESFDETFELHGRDSVFGGVTDFAYVPRESWARVTTPTGGRFALPGARCGRRLPARYGPASGVGVELRGSGNCSRQVNNFAAAGAFEADRLIAVEVLTPGGNWSSYPPHKHDEHLPGRESELEEIYYYEIAAAPGGTPGLGYQRISRSGPGRDSDLLAEVRGGDTVLIPDGWHGPSVAAPGHDMYYLNVMAGPDDERAWLISDHPDHAWIRTTWPEQPVDPRLPLYRAPAGPAASATGTGPTRRLTVAQALIAFLARQFSERDGERHRLIRACWGIFGHGNVAGLGQALLETGAGHMPYLQGRNEQAMVHAAVAHARQTARLSAQAVTTSIGPGATNLVTGAALATVNRLPVLLLPGDTFATRPADPVLQQLEVASAGDVSVNDCLRPVSRYFDRVTRPEALIPAALQAMRVLADPAETGAVTLALPQDVQAEAYDWPEEFFAERVWRVRRPAPDADALAEAAAVLRAARRPLIVAGGGVHHSEAEQALAALADATGIPVASTQAGKGSLRYDHPADVGGIGHTGTATADDLGRTADAVLGVGTRWSDFTTASGTLFAAPGVRFVNLNITAFDGHKMSGLPLVADARAGLDALTAALTGHRVEHAYEEEYGRAKARWEERVDRAFAGDGDPAARPTQARVLGALDALAGDEDVLINAAGSLPGDLHKLWRARSPRQYHVEYGYSCMGYEIPAAIGVALAAPGRPVWALVGDGTYLMMPTEIVTAVQEGVPIKLVLLQNHGYASIGGLSEATGAERFGTAYRFRAADGGYTGDPLPVDLAANAASLGMEVLRAGTVGELREALAAARACDRPVCVHVELAAAVEADSGTGPGTGADAEAEDGVPGAQAWWDVPVAATATRPAAVGARREYERRAAERRRYL